MAGKPKECDCVTQVQEKLGKEGLKLNRSMQFDFAKGTASLGPPELSVGRVGKSKKKLPIVLCAFCPFCGTKYPE